MARSARSSAVEHAESATASAGDSNGATNPIEDSIPRAGERAQLWNVGKVARTRSKLRNFRKRAGFLKLR